MSTKYTKSLAIDFSGSLNRGQFHYEIQDDATITTNLTGITTFEDVVEIVFDSALSGAEVTQLDVLIAAHTPSTEPKFQVVHSAYIRKDQYKAVSYKDISNFIYEGSRKQGPITQILCVAYKNAEPTDYSIRVYDDTNAQVIAENTFTNTTPQIVELTPINNIPLTRAILAVQVKRTGGGADVYMNVENVQFRI